LKRTFHNNPDEDGVDPKEEDPKRVSGYRPTLDFRVTYRVCWGEGEDATLRSMPSP
jgi:hypothetical protein